jgi:hypothetical protein
MRNAEREEALKQLTELMHQIKDWADCINLEQFDNEQGLELNFGVIWFRSDDRTLVGWLGSDLDYGMNHAVEVPLDDEPNPSDGEDMFERAMRRKYPILSDSRF